MKKTCTTVPPTSCMANQPSSPFLASGTLCDVPNDVPLKNRSRSPPVSDPPGSVSRALAETVVGVSFLNVHISEWRPPEPVSYEFDGFVAAVGRKD